MHDVVITGIGLATPLGHDLSSFSEGLFHAEPPFVSHSTRYTRDVPVARVADAGLADEAGGGPLDRASLLAVAAGRRALADAGLLDAAEAERLHNTAVMVGNGSGPTHAVNDAYHQLLRTERLPGLTLLRCLPGGAANALALSFGLKSGNQSYTCACASSTVALGEALRAIRHGYAQRVLVGGSEAPLGDGTLKAWEALRVLAPCGDEPGQACRPFDRDRRGIVLGEGAAFFLLETADAAQARGARVHGRLLGYGSSCDAHHWTEPLADGQVRAMRSALADARLDADAVIAVNAHGTGTTVGDRVEAESLHEVFGARGLAVSSTKSVHGHLLGASGAIELAAALATLHRWQAPPTRNLQNADVPGGFDWISGAPRPLPAGQAVLSNSFAFGGSNASLVIGR